MLSKRLLAARPAISPRSLYLSHPRQPSFIAPIPSAAIVQNTQTRLSSASSHGSADEHGHTEHESHYDPPGGWLWGIRPGEKYEKEGWENIFVYGFFGGFVLFGIAYCFKPDTSIQTWALEEARRRLELEGILEDPFPGNRPTPNE